MLRYQEHWNKVIEIDTDKGCLVTGKQTIPFSEIEDVACCEKGVVRFSGDSDADKGLTSPLLGLRLRSARTQPGRLLGLKSKNLLLRPASAEEAGQILTVLPVRTQNGVWTDQDFPIQSCIVEAKRGWSDYTRGGTVGSHPYRKAGLLSPIIVPEPDLTNGRIYIRYAGMTSRGHESEWFLAHPRDPYLLGDADQISYRICPGTTCQVTAHYCNYRIERDENAKGLWEMILEQNFENICDGLRWLQFLQDAAAGRLSETCGEVSPSTTACGGQIDAEAPSDSPSRTGADRRMLEAALDLLCEAGLLTTEEREEKRKLL